ncbi:uncharacterized protein LOC132713187, partial [Ruditapes philippinarum]|uniref:uncharacterized protein LOC132713187 n=1 Tax=Ruditapes philippinarum TaxID=129788 RepID=UPI00295B2A0E
MDKEITKIMLTISDTADESHSCNDFSEEDSFQNLNILQIPRKRATSCGTVKERNGFINDDIRPRTNSMPTRGTIEKPDTQNLKRQLFQLSKSSDDEIYNVRSFEINSKGVIIKMPDSVRSRSASSIYSLDGEFHTNSAHSIASSSVSRESLGESLHVMSLSVLSPLLVMVLGEPSVGKTGLTQQFMTMEYLGGFNTSV